MIKKKLIAIILGISTVVTLLTGCGKGNDDNIIKVGATPTPHAEILNEVKADLKKQGYTLKIVEYNDYIQPDKALEDGELDANYFQHKPYMEDFNKQYGAHIVSAGKIHFEPFGIYAGKTKSLKNLKKGAIVAVPNDTTNEARALLLLEAQGLIKLKDGAGITATTVDIKSNPLNLQIKEIEAAQVARSVKDVDIICINGNYAIDAGYKVSDALAVEESDSLAADTYANIVAVKSGNENSKKTKALIKALQSDKVRDFINKKYAGAVVPVF